MDIPYYTVFDALADDKLLSKCFHGETQMRHLIILFGQDVLRTLMSVGQ